MFNKVGTVSLFVDDQQRAKKFYTETLGWELRTDAEMYPGASKRWIAVAPKGGETELILYEIDEHWEHYAQVIGKAQAISIDVRNVKQLVTDMKGKGVEFASELDEQPWGASIFMVDSEGNRILLVESAA